MEDGWPVRSSSGVVAIVDRFKLMLDGVPYEIERKGNVLLVNKQEFPWTINGNSVSVGGNAHTVKLSGSTATVDDIIYPIQALGLEEQKPGKTRKAATIAVAEEAGVIRAIMPGLVIKVLKKERDHVKPGDVVIILEAMKMQNELRAKQSGVIKQINVKEGESVEIRQVLAIIEQQSSQESLLQRRHTCEPSPSP
jgi:biotin carboxyl carrier protein